MSSRETPNEDLTQDSKHALIDRLNRLVLRLSSVGSLKHRAISTIHSQVDKIEILVSRVEIKRPSQPLCKLSLNIPREDGLLGHPAPNRILEIENTTVSTKPHFEDGMNPGVSNNTPNNTAKLAQAAEDLASRLSTTVVELQERKVEFKRIHDLLVNQNEKAAKHTLLLEYRIAEMEDDFQSNQSELKFLRIQLQSIQAQCVGCIHLHEDQELDESIMNWKTDWENINRRARGRRKNFEVHLTHQLSETSTVIDST
ncbi:uncharacterized protein L3040_007013 [Drepanopeziza brunnea f. sp. 'multigermtubi']|uniref:uncharacterized protein n=1 Tax=Drepanopeziza brunnea f. sp. 'multigermtubi' TaxID=698441 RepID=UPI0023A11060|nr:hypothetical protein L3040_007013 [Drepanopeziza brunnea f. sp. 'multigermtubi']